MGLHGSNMDQTAMWASNGRRSNEATQGRRKPKGRAARGNSRSIQKEVNGTEERARTRRSECRAWCEATLLRVIVWERPSAVNMIRDVDFQCEM
eukprot:scaffold396_cov127-Isochrysis_galbana.AAC.13